MAGKKRVDPIKQREKRSKIAATAGVVLLVAVGVFEIPSMLAVMNKKAPAGSTYDPGPSSVVPGSLPNVALGGGGTAPAAASVGGQLVDTDVPPTGSDSQLVSFSAFQGKNPFTPQVSSSSSSSTDSGASTSGTSAPTTANKPGADVSPVTPSTPSPGQTVLPSTTPPATTVTATTTAFSAQPTASISVNGVVTRIASQGTFPTGAPVFRLVSWSGSSAQIAIVGGSYAAGNPTLRLRVGVPVTLENQTDGKRYKLTLLSTG